MVKDNHPYLVTNGAPSRAAEVYFSSPSSPKPKPHHMKSLLLTSSAILALSTICHAGNSTVSTPPPPAACVTDRPSGFDDWVNGKFLTGDWGGMRTELEKNGVDIFAYYTTDIAGNPIGGRKEGGFTYTDDFFFGVNLYLEKLVGWKGAKITVSGINRDGHSVTDRYVGSIYNSQQDYGGQATFLYQVTLEQALMDDKFSIKLGRFSASDDFNNSPLYGLYMNNGINGDIRNVLFDTQFSAYPFATWAAQTTIKPTKEITIKGGVFQTTDNVFDRNNHGVDWSIGRHDGVFLIGQVEWAPMLFKKTVANCVTEDAGKGSTDSKKQVTSTTTAMQEEGLPGHYIFGGSFSPWEGFNQFRNAGKTENSYGVYAHADQMVYREKSGGDEGLTLWTAAAYYPQENISIVPFQVNAGIVYQGLIPTRDNDKTIFGVIYGHFSRDYSRNLEETNGRTANYELVLEAAYRFQLTKFAYIQPDVQGIIRPRGTGHIPDALVAGAQMGVVF
jgi:porin